MTGRVDLQQCRGGSLGALVVAVLAGSRLGLLDGVAGQQAGAEAMPNCSATLMMPSIVALQMKS